MSKLPTSPKGIENSVVKIFTFVGKAMVFVLPVVAGMYAFKFIETQRKKIKGQ
jgi:hypothetical protein